MTHGMRRLQPDEWRAEMERQQAENQVRDIIGNGQEPEYAPQQEQEQPQPQQPPNNAGYVPPQMPGFTGGFPIGNVSPQATEFGRGFLIGLTSGVLIGGLTVALVVKRLEVDE